MTLSRRDMLRGSAGLALGAVPARVLAAAPEPSRITPELIAAAQREGKVAWYTAVDLDVAERVGRAFEARYPGIRCVVERSGAERNFQRISQEYASRVYAVDVVNSSDASHLIVWKREGLLAPHVPEDVARHFPAEHKDPDGMFATWRVTLSVVGYNTNLVKPDEAPKSFADLLAPKWIGKIVKAHPAYSGTTLTATYEIARDLGWPYFEKLAGQKVMQVQSGTDPPKKIALGERAVMFDGGEYVTFRLKEAGQPVEIVYPTEGTPLIGSPNGVFKNAPNPNAALLLQNWMFSLDAQQLIVDVGGLRSAHALVKDKPGRKSLSEIKCMKEDPIAVEAEGERIKANYSRYFHI
jgi:iron(III) transport system substrate-binding protein